MANYATRTDRQLAASKRAKYVDTGEASAMLDGLIAPGVLRAMCLAGEVRGALKIRQRVLLPRHIVPTLIQELEFAAPPPRRLKPRVVSDQAS